VDIASYLTLVRQCPNNNAVCPNNKILHNLYSLLLRYSSKILVTTIEYPPGHLRPFKLAREFLHDPIKSSKQSISSKYGYISYFKLGRMLINKPDYIEKVLLYDHGNFKKGRSLQIAKSLLGEGLVTCEGDPHTRQRRIIQPIFHPKQIATYGRVMTDYASTMNKKWKDGATVDILREMMHLTLYNLQTCIKLRCRIRN